MCRWEVSTTVNGISATLAVGTGTSAQMCHKKERCMISTDAKGGSCAGGAMRGRTGAATGSTQLRGATRAVGWGMTQVSRRYPRIWRRCLVSPMTGIFASTALIA